MVSTTASSKLFSALKLGSIQLKHRVVLSPMTRVRADSNHIPTELTQEYYSQRATDGGLLISEGVLISPSAGKLPHAPGIYTDAHIEGWKKVTEKVHAKGGFIFAQLWHPGRATHTSMTTNHELPVAPSAIGIKGKNDFGLDWETPRALSVEEIKTIVQEYATAAKSAIQASFDGVLIHGGFGYLVDQFINTSSNKRTDEYGGSIENRSRFALEIIDAVASAVGPERTAIRFSPWSEYQDMADDTPYETWGYITQQLQARQPNLAFIDFLQARPDPTQHRTLDPFRALWSGPFMTSGNFSDLREEAFETADRTGNLISFGRQFVSNPDLVYRLQNNLPFTRYDRSTFYTHHAEGYIDYPMYDPKLFA